VDAPVRTPGTNPASVCPIPYRLEPSWSLIQLNQPLATDLQEPVPMTQLDSDPLWLRAARSRPRSRSARVIVGVEVDLFVTAQAYVVGLALGAWVGVGLSVAFAVGGAVSLAVGSAVAGGGVAAARTLTVPDADTTFSFMSVQLTV
jgi:hypothetical protein